MQKGGREVPPARKLICAVLSKPVTPGEPRLEQQTTPLCQFAPARTPGARASDCQSAAGDEAGPAAGELVTGGAGGAVHGGAGGAGAGGGGSIPAASVAPFAAGYTETRRVFLKPSNLTTPS